MEGVTENTDRMETVDENEGNNDTEIRMETGEENEGNKYDDVVVEDWVDSDQDEEEAHDWEVDEPESQYMHLSEDEEIGFPRCDPSSDDDSKNEEGAGDTDDSKNEEGTGEMLRMLRLLRMLKLMDLLRMLKIRWVRIFHWRIMTPIF